MSSLIEHAARFLLPPGCLACHAPLGPVVLDRAKSAGALCPECLSILRTLPFDKACPRCGSAPARPPAAPPVGPISCADCERLPLSFSAARSVYPYRSPAGQIVRNMKYQRSPFLGEWLAALCYPYIDDWIEEIREDLHVVPIPLALWRELKRGYNQAGEIASALIRHYRLRTADDRALVRMRYTKPQARFTNWDDRHANLADAFHVRRPGEVHGRRFLLVDDVMTTGMTLASAAKSLMDAGAADVFLFSPVRARFAEDDDREMAR